MEEKKLLGWTLEEFAFAAEKYREKTGKNPLSTLEGACDVQAYWVVAHNNRTPKAALLLSQPRKPLDLGWAKALFQKVWAAMERNNG